MLSIFIQKMLLWLLSFLNICLEKAGVKGVLSPVISMTAGIIPAFLNTNKAVISSALVSLKVQWLTATVSGRKKRLTASYGFSGVGKLLFPTSVSEAGRMCAPLIQLDRRLDKFKISCFYPYI